MFRFRTFLNANVNFATGFKKRGQCLGSCDATFHIFGLICICMTDYKRNQKRNSFCYIPAHAKTPSRTKEPNNCGCITPEVRFKFRQPPARQ